MRPSRPSRSRLRTPIRSCVKESDPATLKVRFDPGGAPLNWTLGVREADDGKVVYLALVDALGDRQLSFCLRSLEQAEALRRVADRAAELLAAGP